MSRSSDSQRLAQLRGRLPMAAMLIVMVIVGWSQLRTSSPNSSSSSTASTTSASRTPTTIASPGLGSAPRTSESVQQPARTTALRPGCESVGFDTVDVGGLPDEALDTLALIASDGPYPYRQDDGVFSNRERLLPKQPTGYYPSTPSTPPVPTIAGPGGSSPETAVNAGTPTTTMTVSA